MRQLESFNENETFSSMSGFCQILRYRSLFFSTGGYIFYYALCKIFQLAIAAQV